METGTDLSSLSETTQLSKRLFDLPRVLILTAYSNLHSVALNVRSLANNGT